jgi:hypothetical protein
VTVKWAKVMAEAVPEEQLEAAGEEPQPGSVIEEALSITCAQTIEDQEDPEAEASVQTRYVFPPTYYFNCILLMGSKLIFK